MRTNFTLWVITPLVLGLAGCDIEDFASARYNQDFHYNYPLKAGGKLSVESFNGAIDVSVWDQDTVDVSGTKYGPTQQAADEVRVEVANTSDSVDIHVVRPSDFRGNRGARFTIKMPRKTLLERIDTSNGALQIEGGSGPAHMRTSNGPIRVRDFAGDLEVRSSNGGIELMDVVGAVNAHTSNARIRAENLQGSLVAGTSNGGITASLAAGQRDRPLRLETSNSTVELTLPPDFASGIHINTSNGHITLHMPGPVNAQVLARTNNSSITSEFEIRTQGEVSRNHLEGVIGNGGPLMELTTSNSPIRLLRM